jgi:hypothetical protein
MSYEEGGSSDSETEGESSSHCRVCVSVMCFESQTQGDGVEKFGGSSSEAPSPGPRLPVRRVRRNILALPAK